ncbi:hypothetical protein C8Q70DRAFT_164735 [Cubamyces menziesii]|nr:hypothetical protein C8Q70DRAFT_164735 [Cubamyces menziesii]
MHHAHRRTTLLIIYSCFTLLSRSRLYSQLHCFDSSDPLPTICITHAQSNLEIVACTTSAMTTTD